MTEASAATFAPILLETRAETAEVRTFRFASPPAFNFVPGQFLMFHFKNDPKTWRAYSLASSPLRGDDYFEITVGMVGAFSDRLGALQPGIAHDLIARGPFGKWVYDGLAEHAVLVGGGTGLAPLRAMCLLKADGAREQRVTLVCSAKTPATLLYRNEHPAWRKAGIEIQSLISRPHEMNPGERWAGRTGRIDAEYLMNLIPDALTATFFICGPNKMVSELRAGLEGRGVPAQQVRTEKWGDYTDLI